MKKVIVASCLIASLLAASPVHGMGHIHRDLRLASGMTAEEIDYLVQGTGLEGLGPAFAVAEWAFEVNALALLSIAILESGWGRSRLAQTKNNLFGINHPRLQSFPYKAASVIYTAYLMRKYYFPKNRTCLADIGHIYAADPQWGAKVSRIWAQLEAKIEARRDP